MKYSTPSNQSNNYEYRNKIQSYISHGVVINGDVFREIACELAEMEKSSTDDSKVFTRNLLPSQAIIDQIYNLSELIQTKLVRIVAI
jgi:hypothetical protein